MLACCCAEDSDRNEQVTYPMSNDLVFVEAPGGGEAGAQALSTSAAPVAGFASVRSSGRARHEGEDPRTLGPAIEEQGQPPPSGLAYGSYLQDEEPLPPPAPDSEASLAPSARSRGENATTSTPPPDPMNATTSPPPPDQAKPPLTDEQKQQEKDRLQELVKSFAKQALQGLPCTYLDQLTGLKHETHYKLCKKLQNLLLVAPPSATFAEVKVAISQVEEIHVLREGQQWQQAAFPPGLLSSLDEEEQSRLLMVSSPAGHICFLETSTQSRDNFLTCMRILRLYCVGSFP